jgi:hypothetical protein
MTSKKQKKNQNVLRTGIQMPDTNSCKSDRGVMQVPDEVEKM